MQALAERLDDEFSGKVLADCSVLGFSGLKTVHPGPKDVIGQTVGTVSRRGKFLVITLDGGVRILVHLSQAGRADIERPAKATKPRGAVVRMLFGDGSGLLIREHGTQRKAGLWILPTGEDGPLEKLGPEPTEVAFETFLTESDSTRHLHSLLRDQRVVAGIGRGYADDALNRARLSPFVALRALDDDERHRLVESVRSVLADALEQERTRKGGLSEPKLGQRFLVHNRVGSPCPNCTQPLQHVSFESHEVVYCSNCQTKGRVLADRRLSRLLR